VGLENLRNRKKSALYRRYTKKSAVQIKKIPLQLIKTNNSSITGKQDKSPSGKKGIIPGNISNYLDRDKLDKEVAYYG
jgi:hypothetical protein